MKTRLLILSLIVLGTLPLQNSFACECEDIDYSVFVENADLVFVGTVNNIVGVENSEEREKLITFDVHSVAKGHLTDNQITTTSDWNSCSMRYEIDATYSVVVTDVKTMSTNVCSTVNLNEMNHLSNIPNSVIQAINESQQLEPVPEPVSEYPIPNKCGEGTILQDGICQDNSKENVKSNSSDKWENPYNNYTMDEGEPILVKVHGDDAPFFGIFVYIDDLFSWIMGK